MSELIDATEMYLRTLYELSEEGVAPLRIRIAERLRQSVPTVSQTVARMERDGLLTVGDDRQIVLTPQGELAARRVMRKHRMAERLLTDVIGLDWAAAHEEACRWEHVMSGAVERRLVALLGDPHVSPYGNPIPALEELDVAPAPIPDGVTRLSDLLPEAGRRVTVRVRRLGELLQADATTLARMAQSGILPGASIDASISGSALSLTTEDGQTVVLDARDADHLFVTAS